MNLLREELAQFAAAVWLGIVLGVSFFAAPIKFTAEVSRSDLLRVGQVTFQAFTWVELVAFAVLLAGIWLRRTTTNKPTFCAIVILAMLLAAQKLIMLPGLDDALTQIVAGSPADSGHLHSAYVVSEVVKALALVVTYLSVRKQTSQSPVAGKTDN